MKLALIFMLVISSAALAEEKRVVLAKQVKTALQPYADGDGVAVPDETNIAIAHT